MNTLVKVIISTVLGFFGTLTEIEDKQATIKVEVCRDTFTMNYDKNTIDYCSFNHNSIKMLKCEFTS